MFGLLHSWISDTNKHLQYKLLKSDFLELFKFLKMPKEQK